MDINFGGFGNMFFESVRYNLKIWVGDALVENKTFETAPQIAEQQFKQIIQDLANNPSPMKAEISCNTASDYIQNHDIYHYDALIFTNKPWDNSHQEED